MFLILIHDRKKLGFNFIMFYPYTCHKLGSDPGFFFQGRIRFVSKVGSGYGEEIQPDPLPRFSWSGTGRVYPEVRPEAEAREPGYDVIGREQSGPTLVLFLYCVYCTVITVLLLSIQSPNSTEGKKSPSDMYENLS